MTRVSVDNQAKDIGTASSGDFGQVLNDALASIPSNRIVTRILVDGKAIHPSDTQSFIQGEPVGELEIRTVDKETWAVTGLDTCLNSLERVQRSLIRAAEMFRETDIGGANQFFAQCIDGLERYYEALTITRCALKLDFNTLQADGISAGKLEEDFGKILSHIILAQEKKDYHSVADRVEYELLTNLSAWATCLRILRNSHTSNA